MIKGTEEDYKNINNLGAKLHIPTPGMHWKFKVEKLNGEIIHEHTERGHSWVRNAYNVLVSQMCGVNADDGTIDGGIINAKQTNGANVPSYNLRSFGLGAGADMLTAENGYYAAISDATRGLIVGIGSDAYNFEQYNLSSQVLDGMSDGKLSHSIVTISKNYDIDNKIYKVSYMRSFTNDGSSDILINEVGMCANIQANLTGTYKVLMTRDVLETPVNVPASSKLTITYELSVTFPA